MERQKVACILVERQKAGNYSVVISALRRGGTCTVGIQPEILDQSRGVMKVCPEELLRTRPHEEGGIVFQTEGIAHVKF